MGRERRYTAGPWVISRIVSTSVEALSRRGSTTFNRAIASTGGYQVNFDDGETIAENEANALLIAAAPELLEELEYRYSQTQCGCGHSACKRCIDDRETERVINKAYGDQS